MATSPQLETARQIVRDMLAKPAETAQEMRAHFAEATSRFNQVADDIKWEPVDAGGVAAEWIWAPNSAENQVLMFLHGGGYMVCSVSTHRDMIARLSRAAGVRALGVEYRLAPEHPFPAALQDATSAYRWLLSTGVAPATDSGGFGRDAARRCHADR